MKIFNITQANIFIKKNGATAIDCGLGNKNKTYVEFEENNIFKDLLEKWLKREI
jgi:tRNA A-37 threonylcarbamoyl transferase component Bud32